MLAQALCNVASIEIGRWVLFKGQIRCSFEGGPQDRRAKRPFTSLVIKRLCQPLRLRRFSFDAVGTQPLSPPRLIGEHIPSGLRTVATLTHMVESRGFRLVPRLSGAGEEEFETRASNDRTGQATLPAGRSPQQFPGRLRVGRSPVLPVAIPRRPSNSRRSSCRAYLARVRN